MQTVLIVDDSKTIRRILADTLRGKYKMLEAANGLEALKLLSQTVPDALITDLHMPVKNGIDLVRSVRQDPSLTAVPILVLTTESDRRFKEMARIAGATAWLQKPFDDEHLLSALRHMLR